MFGQVRRGRRLRLLDDLHRLQPDVVRRQRVVQQVQRQRVFDAARTARAQRSVLAFDGDQRREEGAVADHADSPVLARDVCRGLEGRVALDDRGQARVGARRHREAGLTLAAPQRPLQLVPLGERMLAAAHQRDQGQQTGDHGRRDQQRLPRDPRDQHDAGGDLDQHELLQSHRAETAGFAAQSQRRDPGALRRGLPGPLLVVPLSRDAPSPGPAAGGARHPP